jgi:hypothetical protein
MRPTSSRWPADLLLVPEAATQKHLEILSEIAELLSDSPCASASRPAPMRRAARHDRWLAVHPDGLSAPAAL